MTQGPSIVTPQALLEFHRILLKEMAGKYGGDRTLNEIRVLNQIVRCGIEGRTCSVTALHTKTGIPIPTVSRAVANLQKGGWVTEARDPDDGRKRIISLNPQTSERTLQDLEGNVACLNSATQKDGGCC